jgi:hypothetical protein
MISRTEQKAIYDKLLTSLTINTYPDGSSGNNVIIPVHVYWGKEPVTQELPSIVIKFTSFNNVLEKALSDIYTQDINGSFVYGFQGQDIMKVKVRAIDYNDEINKISESDIAQAIMNIIYALKFSNWDGVLTESAVVEQHNPIDDVSEIRGDMGEENEIPYELQTVINFTNFVGGVPVETSPLNNTAPLIEYAIIKMGILPNNDEISISV